MPDIFLSYSSRDRQKAAALASAVAAADWSLWWDRDIRGGEEWDGSINEHLSSAKVVVVLWSRSSIGSDWVHHEARVALERKCLLPVLLDPVTPPDEFAAVQAIPVTTWIAGERDHLLRPLFDQLASLLGTSLTDAIETPVQEAAARMTRIAIAETVFEFCEARSDFFRLRDIPGGVDEALKDRMGATYDSLAQILAPISDEELHDFLNKHQGAFAPPDARHSP